MKKPVSMLSLAALILAGAGFIWYFPESRNASVSPELLAAQQVTLTERLGADGAEPSSVDTDTSLPSIVGFLPLAAEAAQNYSDALIEPVDGFADRITKKPFGIYITPETSPVHPDRFTGYHTGVDAEYENVVEDVPVRAIDDGTVVLSRISSGYGGVLVIRHAINGVAVFALYGHLDPASLPAVGTRVRQGQNIGILGEGGGEETDGARKHIHFAMLKKEILDVRGYVLDEAELADWYDPLDFFGED